jgi:hypothetical protein
VVAGLRRDYSNRRRRRNRRLTQAARSFCAARWCALREQSRFLENDMRYVNCGAVLLCHEQPPAQLDAFPPQQAPDRIVRGIQRCGQRSPRPTGQSLGRRQFQLAQNPQAQIRAIFGGLARPSPIPQPSCRKALEPQTNLFGRTPNSRPTASFGLPSRQAKTILARSSKRASSIRLRARAISSALFSVSQVRATATRAIGHAAKVTMLLGPP